jgi:OOP family OmpA-OmpF porin
MHGAWSNVTIQVTGYTDALGSVGYNQRLSERRASNVANALAQSGGCPASHGRQQPRQERPAVPTARWRLREPQNRRVEIVFQ